MLPAASADREARFLVFTGRTGRWKGIFAVHSWVVFKPENATSWSRYDVVGWGQPVRSNGWAPDGRWFGDAPRVLVDVRGPEAAALIPRVKAAIADYSYSNFGDYRIWPGPNSNTFTATVLRAVPQLEATLPSNAVGKDFRPYPYVGLTDSGTGIEASLWGLLGVKARLGRGHRGQLSGPGRRASTCATPRSSCRASAASASMMERRSPRLRRRSDCAGAVALAGCSDAGPHSRNFVRRPRWPR